MIPIVNGDLQMVSLIKSKLGMHYFGLPMMTMNFADSDFSAWNEFVFHSLGLYTIRCLFCVKS